MRKSKKRKWFNHLQNVMDSSIYQLTKDVISRIPGRPVMLELLYTAQLDNSSHQPQKTDQQIIIKEANSQDIGAICQCLDKRSIFENRFSIGDICLVAVDDEIVVGYEWFCANPTHHEERGLLIFTIPSDSIYSYDAYVKPSHRGKHVFSRITDAGIKLTQAKNRKKLIALFEKENNASLIAHKRLGYKIISAHIFINILGKHISIKRKTPKAWPISNNTTR